MYHGLFEGLRQLVASTDNTKMPTSTIDPMLNIFEVLFECIVPEQLILLVANMILERLDTFESYYPSETWVRERIMHLMTIAGNHHELAALSSEFPEFDYDTPSANALVSACMLLWMGASQTNQYLVRRRRLKGAIVSIYSAFLDIHKHNPALTEIEKIQLAWHFWQILIERIESILGEEKTGQVTFRRTTTDKACTDKSLNLRECSAFPREYIHRSVQAALSCMKKVYNDNDLKIQIFSNNRRSLCGEMGKCWIVRSGKQFRGFITCCPCCDDSSGKLLRSERCRIHW